MKAIQIVSLVIVAAALMIGSAMAAIPVPATVGTATISSSTAVQATGNVAQSDSLTWIQDSEPSHAPPLHSALMQWAQWNPVAFAFTYPFPFFWIPTDASVGANLMDHNNEVGEVRGTAGYTATNTMVQGTTVLTKSVAVNSNNVIGDKNNIQSQQLITFAAQNEAGQATGSEDILMDVAGAAQDSNAKSYNPFGPTPNYFPPFADTVQSGSGYNILLGTIDTAAGERFVAATGDQTIAQSYSVLGRGITSSTGTAPMVGSMNAYMNAHVQEGIIRQALSPGGFALYWPTGPAFFGLGVTPFPIFESGLGSDVTYAQSVSAAGSITSFSQSYSFTGNK